MIKITSRKIITVSDTELKEPAWNGGGCECSVVVVSIGDIVEDVTEEVLSVKNFKKGVIHKPCGHGRGEGGLPNVHVTT